MSKIEEVDPLHEELSDFINRQQIVYLTAITGRIMDNEFGEFLKENFEENMSNYAKRTENESRGVGHAESYTPIDEKVNRKQEKRMQRAAARIVSKRESSTTANCGKGKAPQDIKAALDETGWGITTSSPKATSSRGSATAQPSRTTSLTVSRTTRRRCRTAVTAWLTAWSDPEALYGSISDWDMSEVTDMVELFVPPAGSSATDFKDDIGAWDVSRVTDMSRMFQYVTTTP